MKRLSVFIPVISLIILLSGCMGALHTAAEKGDIKEMERLIAEGTDVNAKGGNGETALHYAARNGHVEAIRLLIEKGANVNMVNRFGWTALHGAALEGYTETVKLLIEKGADVNAEDGNDRSALYYAARNGHVEAIRLLIEKGADMNIRTRDGWTALTQAAWGGHTEIVKLLIEKGADIDMVIAHMEQFAIERPGDAAKVNGGIKLIERFAKKQQPINQPAMSQNLTKEDMEKIIQSAVEKAKTDKGTKSPAIQSDIDRPIFNQTEKIMGENDLAVIIGIEGYQGIPKSDYSYDDARLVGDYAKALGFKPRNVELLLEERATKSAIEKIIKTWLPNKAKPESRVFIYYSGHGAPEPKTGDAYLVPYDGDPNYLPDTGYPLKRFYENLGKLQVAEVTVVLDACFSGAGGRSVLAKGARPLVMMAEGLVLPQHIAVLTATQGSDISTASPEKGHGIFTYYFLKALKDGKKNIADIYEYIKPMVEDEAKQLNVQQSPSISPDAEKLKGRFSLRK